VGERGAEEGLVAEAERFVLILMAAIPRLTPTFGFEPALRLVHAFRLTSALTLALASLLGFDVVSLLALA
jgi:hypothetical protein